MTGGAGGGHGPHPWPHARDSDSHGGSEGDSAPPSDDWEWSDDWECGPDWADSDGSAGMSWLLETDSEAEDSAGTVRGGCSESECYAAPHAGWPDGGGVGGAADSDGAWGPDGGGGAAEDWAAFPGPLPPIVQQATAAAAATAAGGGRTACEPMGLSAGDADSDWAAWLAPPMPPAAWADPE
jgi:hypothetical protein